MILFWEFIWQFANNLSVKMGLRPFIVVLLTIFSGTFQTLDSESYLKPGRNKKWINITLILALPIRVKQYEQLSGLIHIRAEISKYV